MGIENLLVVVERRTPYRFGEKKYFGFDPLTIVPMQRDLIVVELLNNEEITYIDMYHTHVRESVGPLLKDSTADSELASAWLVNMTEPLRKVEGTSPVVGQAAIALSRARL